VDAMTEVPVQKKCPSCGKEMEEGYIISKMGVYWDTHVPRFIAPGNLLSPNTTEVFKMHYIHSFRCKSCKILNYGDPSDFVKIACPNCNAVYEYEIPRGQARIICQNCGKEFIK
jgi:phage FluMu protein Com